MQQDLNATSQPVVTASIYERWTVLIFFVFSFVNYVVKIKRTQMKPEGKAEDNKKKEMGSVTNLNYGYNYA